MHTQITAFSQYIFLLQLLHRFISHMFVCFFFVCFFVKRNDKNHGYFKVEVTIICLLITFLYINVSSKIKSQISTLSELLYKTIKVIQTSKFLSSFVLSQCAMFVFYFSYIPVIVELLTGIISNYTISDIHCNIPSY